jgi:hypothetical protein
MASETVVVLLRCPQCFEKVQILLVVPSFPHLPSDVLLTACGIGKRDERKELTT